MAIIKEDENVSVSAEIIDKTEAETKNNELNIKNNSCLADYEILNPELPMSEKVDITVRVADTLKKVIEAQRLVITGLNKKNPKEKYVLTGGWEMLNTFMGITPVTRVIDEITNDKGRIVGYKSACTLLRNPVYENGKIVGGVVVGYAEASATKEGFQKETSSMMSMSGTRAFNKATRQSLGWIMQMAGYQGTPAEEMPTFREDKG